MAVADINTLFCRELLKTVMADVRNHTTAEERKAAWVYYTYRHGGNNQFEFHGPAAFYWHGRADNADDARAKGCPQVTCPAF
jgi:hypothetical protein